MARPKEGMAEVTTYLPAETKRELKLEAVKRDMTLQDLVCDVLMDWLRTERKETQP